MNSKIKMFLTKKDIEFSVKRYFQDGLAAMASGLFASLLIGLIFKTLGEQIILHVFKSGIVYQIADMFVDIGNVSMKMMGAAIGVSVSMCLKSPGLVIFTSAITGTMGSNLGGPAGAFISAIIGSEFGKAVSKETKVDIIVTPAVTLIFGMLSAKMIGPVVNALMNGLGKVIMSATELRPVEMGIIVAVVVGLVLTAPISSAALCIMLSLSGIAGGAAVAGCSAQMIGFAVASYRENKVAGLVAQGIGTSMLQVPNIIKHPCILIPPTIAAAVSGPVSTAIFKMKCEAVGAGMGTCGFVGQIATFTAMGFSGKTFFMILITHIFIPAIVAYLVNVFLRKSNYIKDGDYLLDL